MLITEFYNGQGLGNQLWCYAVTKTIALDNGYEFKIQSPNKFKGAKLFPNIVKDCNKEVIGGSGPEGGPPETLPDGIKNYYKEKKTVHPYWNCDISLLDSKMQNVEDNTKVDGVMQAEDYILHRKEEIKEWLKISEEYNVKDFCSDDICVINLRGTPEYIGQPQLFLQPSFFYSSMKYMLQNVNDNMRFVVVTDDVETSRQFFPNFEIYHKSLEWDYSIIHNARYTIISNSSFAWFPVWTSSENKLNIAPKYWARHNISDGFWSNGDSLTRNWLYLSKENNMYTYNYCLKEKNRFQESNKSLFL